MRVLLPEGKVDDLASLIDYFCDRHNLEALRADGTVAKVPSTVT
jgi:hypothetical protein